MHVSRARVDARIYVYLFSQGTRADTLIILIRGRFDPVRQPTTVMIHLRLGRLVSYRFGTIELMGAYAASA